MNKKQITEIIIPVYNEEMNIKKICDEILKFKDQFSLLIHFIDDGSTDNTWLEILNCSKKNNFIKGTKFTRNFGKDYAILAGIKNCESDYALIMDGDFQHPTKYIPVLIDKIQNQKTDIVNAKKINLESNLLKNLYYKIFKYMTSIDLKFNSDFKIINKKVINYFKQVNEINFFFRGMVEWSGFKSNNIDFEVGDRFLGKTKYSLFSLIKFGLNLVLSYSTVPLRLITFTGFFLLVLSSIFFIRTIYLKFFSNIVDGYTTLISIILIFFSFLIISVGLVGEYIGNVYKETKSRPLYIIDKKF